MPGTKFLGAFNTAIAAELEKRVKADDPVSQTVTTGTMHGAGFGIWRLRHPKAKYLRGKIRKVFQEIAVQSRRPFAERYIDYACDMVGYAMNAGLGLDDPRDLQDDKQWLTISGHFDADRALDKKLGANEQAGIQWARATLIRSLEHCPEAVTFDEMLYAPLYNGLSAPRFDNVLIDEAQDSSVPRILLAERMLSEGGRLFAVGDRHQSIYGFAGADSSAMQNIIERFSCTVLRLSMSFRCPRAVVLYAQQFVGRHIEPADNAPEGIARRRSLYPGWWQEDRPQPGDVILCRFNAPLAKLAYELLLGGVPCRMAGRQDLGISLKSLAKRWQGRPLDVLEAGLQDWVPEELGIARLCQKPERANAAIDIQETIQTVMDRCRESGHRSVDDLIREIDRLFISPNRSAVLLSSIHKAKGKEWPRVYWMQVPPRFRGTQQEWQDHQEVNLRYVAATRAMHELVLVREQSS
jgi:DNA helicase II / ATP-dependent DNA helicase PcrA